MVPAPKLNSRRLFSLGTLCVVLEYDGTDFQGWQSQAQGRTVQTELARALRVLLREPIQPIGAGRTDAGTHALGQVAHFHTCSPLPLERLHRGLNGLLPADIAVRAVREATADFHARYSARGKRYRYRIHRGKAALNRRYVWSLPYCLDVEAMRTAVAALPGRHSFGAFCKQDPKPDNFYCRIAECGLARLGEELVFEIEADRFLRHMVRILVGTLVEIGRGRWRPGRLRELLDAGVRENAGVTAPARGLCLLWVDYGHYQSD